MFEVICHECDMDVVAVDDGLAALRVENGSWVFTIPLTAMVAAELIEKLSSVLLAAAA